MDINKFWEEQLVSAREVLAGIDRQIEGASSEDLPQSVKEAFLLRLEYEKSEWNLLVLSLEDKLKN